MVMKRHTSSFARRSGGLISSGSAQEDMVYGAVVPSMLDSFDGVGEDHLVDGEDMLSSELSGKSGEKKRRLSAQQVKALEKSFEVENKLEPERKVKLAQEIGLQPRQVAIWFQNRRARWKTKQLERDYGILKTDYDAIKISCDDLRHEKDVLLAEIKELRTKLAGDSGESYGSIVKEEPLALEEEMEDKSSIKGKGSAEAQDYQTEPLPLVYKDGSSDSDSSAILNDEISSNYPGRSGILYAHNLEGEEEEEPALMGFNPFQRLNGRDDGKLSFCCYQQHLKEEHNFFSEEEPCSSCFFSDEQPPESPWYCSEELE